MSDKILRCTGKKAEFRLVVVDASQTAQEITSAHGAPPEVSTLMGEVICGALLMAAGLKQPGALQVALHYQGSLSQVSADATPMGLVRATVNAEELRALVDSGKKTPPHFNLEPKEIRVIKWSETGSLLHESRVPMAHHRTGPALTGYLLQSEQIPSSLGLFSGFHEGKLYALGFLIEALPRIDEETLSALEENLCTLRSPTEYREGSFWNISAWAQALGGGFEIEVHREFDVQAFCPCTRERALKGFLYLPEPERNQLFEEKGKAEIICEYCRRVYTFSQQDLGLKIK